MAQQGNGIMECLKEQLPAQNQAQSLVWLGKGRFIKFEPLTHNHLPDTRSALCAGEAVFFLSWRAPHEDAEDADPALDHLQVRHHLLL